MKKLLFYSIAVLTMTVFSDCKNGKTPKSDAPASDASTQMKSKGKKAPEQPHVFNQLVINFENETDVNSFLNDPKIKDLGLKLVATCPCSKKLILVEAPPNVTLNPDGDASAGAKGHGGDKTGVSWNYEFDQGEITKSNTDYVDRSPKPKKTTASVNVSTIDSGVDFYNPFLNPFLSRNRANSTYCNTKNREGIYGLNIREALTVGPFSNRALEPIDRIGHGTAINGIIAGKADVESVARPDVELYTHESKFIDIKQLNVSFSTKNSVNGNLFHALCGIHYSLNKGSKIINASWGIMTYYNETSQMEVFNTTLAELASKENDALLVVSSGNNGVNFDNDDSSRLTWPAALSIPQEISYTYGMGKTKTNKLNFSGNIITVGAWDIGQNVIARFSNRGSKIVNIYAPGVDVLSIRLGREPNCASVKGTSFAAPFVTRSAAVLKGLNQTWRAKEVKNELMRTAFPNAESGQSPPILLLRAPTEELR
jgi:subtilisin family serine protease